VERGWKPKQEEERMSLTLKDLEPGTLAVDGNGKLAVVLEHKLNYPKNPIIYTAKPGGTVYKGPPSFFKAVVGVVDLDAFESAAGPSVPKAKGVDHDFMVPDALKGIKIGDKIEIRARRGTEVVTYEGYNSRRPKYPVSFTDAKGRSMKGGLSLVIGKVAETA
jgi:hypothetical protein